MNLKIVYFDFPFWRAEVARISLFKGNISFDDIRVNGDEFKFIKEHGKMKDGTLVPFRQLPILVVEGKTIAQTGAIARICGKLSGLYPEEMIEAGKVDQIIDTATDINVLLRPSMRESDPVKRKAMRVELAQNDLPKYFGYLENILTDNKSHWFVDDKMSIADIAIWRLMGWITSGAVDDIPKNILNPFKNLNKLYNEVKEDEKVSEWMLKTYKK